MQMSLYKRSMVTTSLLFSAALVVAASSAMAQDQVTASTTRPVGGFVYPTPGTLPAGPGVLPPKVAAMRYLAPQNYGRPVARDLGFSGVLSGQSVWTYGDTSIPDSSGDYELVANDSSALGDNLDLVRIFDDVNPGTNVPSQWIQPNAEENANGGLSRYSFGGTNVVEYAPGQGLVWYLKNDRGTNGLGIIGAGVATVTADATGAIATRTSDTTWGADEPWWGDIGVAYNPQDGDVYVYGHGPIPFDDNVYLARAPGARATDVTAYQYWNQSTQSWTTQRFTLSGGNGTIKLTNAMSLFPNRQLGQSNPFWSNHYNSWMFVAGADVGYTDVQVMTASKLEGPWTKPFTIASTCPNNVCSAIRYAITPHPEYDLSGKNLLVTWTDSNVIYSVVLRWK